MGREESENEVRVKGSNGRVYTRRMRYVRHDGYVVTWRRGRKELEHRVVAEEQVLGRPLRKGEVVHHLDGDRANNDPTNLEVHASQAEHAAGHGKKCEPECGCGRHVAYERTPEHRQMMSERVAAAKRERRSVR